MASLHRCAWWSLCRSSQLRRQGRFDITLSVPEGRILIHVDTQVGKISAGMFSLVGKLTCNSLPLRLIKRTCVMESGGHHDIRPHHIPLEGCSHKETEWRSL
jgi:hypothetical protein